MLLEHSATDCRFLPLDHYTWGDMADDVDEGRLHEVGSEKRNLQDCFVYGTSNNEATIYFDDFMKVKNNQEGGRKKTPVVLRAATPAPASRSSYDKGKDYMPASLRGEKNPQNWIGRTGTVSGLSFRKEKGGKISVLLVRDVLVSSSLYEDPKGGRDLLMIRRTTGRTDLNIWDTMSQEHLEEAEDSLASRLGLSFTEAADQTRSETVITRLKIRSAQFKRTS